MLSIGSTGRAVAFLQYRLGLTPSGTFDTMTDTALRGWQTEAKLKADGVYGPVTNTAMTGRREGVTAMIAKDFAIVPTAFAAILQVETTGSGFLDDGRPKILLERHYVYRLAAPAQRNQLSADVCYPTAGNYGAGGANQWDRFEKVAAVSLDLAIQSCSWGIGQVMGANWRDLKELSAQLMMWGAARDEYRQLVQMGAFIVSKPGLRAALNAQNWAEVARLYNGPNYAANAYDMKLAAAFKALTP